MLQMEFDGRPDGRRIHDAATPGSNIHQRRQREHDAANPGRRPVSCSSPKIARELLREGVQYYHRYICFWHLGHYELCARDTERNLRLFAFVREHARDDRDKLRFDQWRPYVTMMHARAVATPLVELEQWDAAAGVLDAGIRGIEQFLEEYNQVESGQRKSASSRSSAAGRKKSSPRSKATNRTRRRRPPIAPTARGSSGRAAGTNRVGHSRRAVRRRRDAARRTEAAGWLSRYAD